MTLQVASNNVYSGQGVAISVTGIAQVHILPRCPVRFLLMLFCSFRNVANTNQFVT
jgi:hypothetical protein